MANGHRTQIKRARNAVKDTRPHAKLTYARIPVQKACFVMDAIRGKDVTTAIGILEYNPRYASGVILKLLNSAVANAENNLGMNAANLYIAEANASDGPIMKRIQPRAQGRAYRILKRMSNLYIVLDEKKAEKTEEQNAETAAEK
ncbi:large subunit ribosomal protein L22 [Lachnospiraceae bacterium NK3A20]|jgi:large subunit ribosomal protein L22|nr:large subunit ribosomal protein L22 [Lachnospiraceae bacterium NK3A20]